MRFRIQIYRGVLVLYAPPESNSHRARYVAIRHLVLQTDRLESSNQSLAGSNEVDGAEGSRGRHGQSAGCRAIKGEVVRRYFGLVCAAVCVLPIRFDGHYCWIRRAVTIFIDEDEGSLA